MSLLIDPSHIPAEIKGSGLVLFEVSEHWQPLRLSGELQTPSPERRGIRGYESLYVRTICCPFPPHLLELSLAPVITCLVLLIMLEETFLNCQCPINDSLVAKITRGARDISQRGTMHRAVLVFCVAFLVGCSSGSSNFVKLDATGKKDLSANAETLQRDIADCKVLEAHVREEGGTVFNTSSARMAFNNCMRSKGYVAS